MVSGGGGAGAEAVGEQEDRGSSADSVSSMFTSTPSKVRYFLIIQKIIFACRVAVVKDL